MNPWKEQDQNTHQASLAMVRAAEEVIDRIIELLMRVAEREKSGNRRTAA